MPRRLARVRNLISLAPFAFQPPRSGLGQRHDKCPCCCRRPTDLYKVRWTIGALLYAMDWLRKGKLLELWNRRLGYACVRLVPDGLYHLIRKGAIVGSQHSLAQVDKLGLWELSRAIIEVLPGHMLLTE
jgi:hypothetical protein